MPKSDPLNKQPASFTVRFVNLDRHVVALAGETLLQSARRNGVRIAGACGGRGVCGSCLVRITSGQVEILSPDASQAEQSANEQGWLRACCIRPESDLLVEVSPRAFALAARSDLPALDDDPVYDFDPPVTVCEIQLEPPHVDGASAQERLYVALGEDRAAGIDMVALQSLPRMLRYNGGRLLANVRQGEVIGFTAFGSRPLGLAIDLGTTNIAGSLTNLENGERLANLGIENPQTAYGADLISRINHAIRTPDGGRELQSAIVNAFDSLASLLCEAVAADPSEIADITICGNTAMHHLLLGLPVTQLGRAPFIPATCKAIDIKARDLGLDVMPGAFVHLLPNIGGFVGGDHVAALLATEHLWRDRTCLVIDIGTNTEISLIHNKTISTASTASGPALEGGNLSCGMRAAEGAIEKVWLDEGRIRTRVIGGGRPLGLCGSGVLDALNTLHKAGVINQRGYIAPGGPNVKVNGGLQEYSLAPDVIVTQNDVRSILLAKAAIRAGQDMLFEEAGVTEQELERVVIAGAFGAYIDIAGAIDIGLFPALPPERFQQVGNAAGTGVRMALVSAATRAKAAQLAPRCSHIELNSLPGFQKAFICRIGI